MREPSVSGAKSARRGVIQQALGDAAQVRAVSQRMNGGPIQMARAISPEPTSAVKIRHSGAGGRLPLHQ